MLFVPSAKLFLHNIINGPVQALKAAQDVSADPRKIDQYRDNPDLYAFLEVLIGRR